MDRRRAPMVQWQRGNGQDVETRSGGDRRSLRVEVDMPVSYRREENAPATNAVAKNLSAGGLQLCSTEELSVGQMLIVEFSIEGHQVSTRGRVVLSFFNGHDKMFAHGVAFTQLDTDARESLTRYVKAGKQATAPSSPRP